MTESQQSASVAALRELGYAVDRRQITVSSVEEDAPAASTVKAGDVIRAVDGRDVSEFAQLISALAAHEPGDEARLTLEREGQQIAAAVRLAAGDDGSARLGVSVVQGYELPIDVSIQIDKIGGPSAGMMFALGIIDALTPADELAGHTIAGTGTIDADGKVGAIGGIEQKMVASRRDGASWFLAPEANCSEVASHVPDGLQVAAVSTLAQARAAMTAIGRDQTDGLAPCH